MGTSRCPSDSLPTLQQVSPHGQIGGPLLDEGGSVTSKRQRCPECEEIFNAEDLNYDEPSGQDVCDDCLVTREDSREAEDNEDDEEDQ
jgi:hypothetical protein